MTILRDDAELPSHDGHRLMQLSRISRVLEAKLGWRKRRDASLMIFRLLSGTTTPALLRRLAKAITGVEPEEWLTVAEATESLKSLGVKTYSQLLYRLAKKARKTPACQMEIAIDGRGRWDSPGYLHNPVALITVRVDGAVRFRVSKPRREV